MCHISMPCHVLFIYSSYINILLWPFDLKNMIVKLSFHDVGLMKKFQAIYVSWFLHVFKCSTHFLLAKFWHLIPQFCSLWGVLINLIPSWKIINNITLLKSFETNKNIGVQTRKGFPILNINDGVRNLCAIPYIN